MTTKFTTFGKKKNSQKRIAFLAALALSVLISPAVRGSQSVSLAWDASSDPGVAGYVLYGGTSPTNYTMRVNVGTNITATITGLTEGRTNYFAVTAYNSAQMESAASLQITYLVPGLLTMNKGVAGAAPRMNFPVAIGHWYEVQASTNLTAWSTVWQTTSATSNSWVGYQDPQGTVLKNRFYRLVMH